MPRLQCAQDAQESEPHMGFKEFQALAQEGSQGSLIYLGWACYSGLGTTQDEVKAEVLWRQALERHDQPRPTARELFLPH